MENNKRKLLGVRVDAETHKQLKLHAVEKGVTIQDYLLDLIKKDMKQNKQKRSM
jgi:predicted HicB family RNase H-like nuclease